MPRQSVNADMIHPLLCYLGIALSFFLSFKLYQSGLNVQEYFYLPAVFLIGFYTAHAMQTDKQVYEKRRWLQSVVAATGRYVFWGLVLLGVYALYRYHPGYNTLTTNTQRLFLHLLCAFAVCGWPYFFLSDRYRHCRANVLLDHYITVNVLLRALARGGLTRFRRRLATRQVKRLLVSGALRIHFIPVMFEQVYTLVTAFMTQCREQSEQVSFAVTPFGMEPHVQPFSLVLVLTTLAWLIDANNAGIGYFWESRFTRTAFRDVDPYPSHWVVTLACYIPFIYFVTAFVAEFPTLPDESERIFGSASWNHAVDVAMVVVLVLYMASGSALSFSWSNLSYKKIQTKGLYAIIRHPGITFKIIWFSLAFYRFAPAYSLAWLACYVFWMGIYVYRAFIEEEYLRQFPDYQAYMQRTRYRFIPGLV